MTRFEPLWLVSLIIHARTDNFQCEHETGEFMVVSCGRIANI